MIPGNIRFQFYPVQSPVPTFSLGLEDGLAVREMIARSPGGAAPRVSLRLDVKMVPNLKTATIWGTLPGTTDENIMVVAHRDGWFEGANDNGTGVATLLGIAEHFAKVPAAERRRTITFVGSTGHHDGTAESGTWLLQHKELFAKTALIINCEHTLALGPRDAGRHSRGGPGRDDAGLREDHRGRERRRPQGSAAADGTIQAVKHRSLPEGLHYDRVRTEARSKPIVVQAFRPAVSGEL